MKNRYKQRDLSWLDFNERVLLEAATSDVPLMERFNFLSIFSSNLDEFYRVRMPSLVFSDHKNKNAHARKILNTVQMRIDSQQEKFGLLLRNQLIPELNAEGIEILYQKPLYHTLSEELGEYFYTEVLGLLEIVPLKRNRIKKFFAKNNVLYQVIVCEDQNEHQQYFIVNIPTDILSRFYTVYRVGKQMICFLDDIMKNFLPSVIRHYTVKKILNIKITRDAELDLQDEYEGDLAEKIERQLKKRDLGDATRLLYERGADEITLDHIIKCLGISKKNIVEGGAYHHLKDLSSLPVNRTDLLYKPLIHISPALKDATSVLETIGKEDLIIHTPYHSYNTVLKFFNEAATNPEVNEIYTTLYRVAGNSKIARALITAARNGKKVTVFIELKARFDEENNLRWAAEMKNAGVKIINSIPGLKVHAKVALIVKKVSGKQTKHALIATGNLNEITSRFYTDHVFFTSHKKITKELKNLFSFLTERRKPFGHEEIKFDNLLVSQFNLQKQFLKLIDTEISNAKNDKPAGIILKMNNLEDMVLIEKLYEAAEAGVKIDLLVRSICCLNPEVPSLKNISAKRIVSRYLEHGRVFIFKNGGIPKVYLGSSDWMNRNIYHRIEVCCPVYNEKIKNEVMAIVDLQLNDRRKATAVNHPGDIWNEQTKIKTSDSQTGIYRFLSKNSS
ncbi:polyphosphate kinase 1 [Chryseobacterium luteum]|uniref:Polyphosphate kinase n=1 Tax=Chryseobacterium luteum TaxID=421531 RepID=A0A085YXQ1_9FLAO|nr:polyphosphate kinase 1 [Chryseobacterium luteum]KFE96964.1 hypothetical protein IX38_22320 [Chryseobacterium luteum]